MTHLPDDIDIMELSTPVSDPRNRGGDPSRQGVTLRCPLGGYPPSLRGLPEVTPYVGQTVPVPYRTGLGYLLEWASL